MVCAKDAASLFPEDGVIGDDVASQFQKRDLRERLRMADDKGVYQD